MISIDTETTGIDFYHGSAKPFLVTICFESREQTYFEWPVDPLTREPQIPDEDVEHLRQVIAEADVIVGQNIRFDVRMLSGIGITDWPWHKTHDTLIAGHLLSSNTPHDLTSLGVRYLGKDITEYEEKVGEATAKCRRIVQQDRLRIRRGREGATGLGQWAIADKGMEGMPSCKEKTWKYDMWLPRAMASHLWSNSRACARWNELQNPLVPTRPFTAGRNIFNVLLERDKAVKECSSLDGWEYHPPGIAGAKENEELHEWWTVLAEYANADSAITLALWPVMEAKIYSRKLWSIYQESMCLPPIVLGMEDTGVTLSGDRLRESVIKYNEESYRLQEECIGIAASYRVKDEGGKTVPFKLSLPKGGRNHSLDDFVFNVLKVPPLYDPKGRQQGPTLNKAALEMYEQTLEDEKARQFFKALRAKRSRDTAFSYLEGYTRFWLPVLDRETGKWVEGYYVLHPSLNQTGTDTLRFSCSMPNEQNISKKEGFNLRYTFGPVPGREWWDCDAQNLELRIPSYESGQQEFIDLFENPTAPPYFGSNHLLIAHLLFAREFDDCLSCQNCRKEILCPASLRFKDDGDKFCKCASKDPMVDGRVFKKRYAATKYQDTKNGNFAVQYGAVDRPDGMGTADRTYKVKGAQAIISARFSKQDKLNRKWIGFAEEHGYVETLPDKSVDPLRGYPIVCSRTEYGRIKPTVPLNYHVQGTAMWWTRRAMVRCQEQLDTWRQETGFDGRMAMQVHDSIVFDFPKSRCHPKEDLDPDRPDGIRLMRRSNLWRIVKLQKLMEQCGEDIGVPTPTSREYHPNNWADGESI